MALPLQMSVWNAPYGLDMDQTRIWARGRMVFDSGSSYTTGGLLPNWNAGTGTLGLLQYQNGENVLLGTYTQPSIVNITGLTVSGTTCVFLTAKPPVAGQYVTFSGFTNADSTPFNGITAKVTSVSAGVSFTCTITTTATTVTDTGTAAVVIGPDSMTISGISGYTYSYNKADATVKVFQVPASGSLGSAAPQTELAASSIPAAVALDTVEFQASWAKQ